LERELLFQIEAACPAWRDAAFLLIGHSHINRKMLLFFQRRGVRAITLCTRQAESLKGEEARLQVAIRDPRLLPQWNEFDVVISATETDHYLIGEESGVPARRTLIFDLSVPRSIDPCLGLQQGIALFDIQTLGTLVEYRREGHAQQIKELRQEAYRLAQHYAALYQARLQPSRA
jgi:glutamyl-tRNA reductase